MNYCLSSRFFLTSILLFLCSVFRVEAALEISQATLAAGNTLTRGNNMNVSLCFTLKNTGDTAEAVQLTAEPLEGSRSAIYTRALTLPPKSMMRDSMPLFMTDSERFLISLIHGGRVVDKEDFSMRNFYGARALKAALVNDEEKAFPTTMFRRNPQLKWKINEDHFRADLVPEHWGFLQDYAMVMLLEPDFSVFSQGSWLALRDYVLQGGVLFICSPRTAVNLKNCILEELLPAEPLEVGELTGLGFCRRALGLPPAKEKTLNEFGETVPPFRTGYLQAVPREGSVGVLAKDGNPLAYLRPFGLGMVIQLTVNPFCIGQADKKLGTELWNALLTLPGLSYENYLPDRKAHVNQILQNLQGYKIPSVGVVMKLFWIYVLAGLGLLLLFLKKKKVILGWGVFCIFGIFMTGLIFCYSRYVSRNQPSKSVIGVTVSARTALAGGGPVLATGNLISKSDCRADVFSPVDRTGYYPQKWKWAEKGGETVLAGAALRIQQDAKNISLPRMSLKQLRPRTLCWTVGSSDFGGGSMPLPRLLLGGRKAEFVPWKFQGPKNRAMLLLPGEIRPLSIEGDMIADRGGSYIETDTILTQAQEYLRSLNLKVPALAVLQIRDGGESRGITVRESETVYSSYDYHFELIPLDVQLAEPDAPKIWYGTDMMKPQVPEWADTRQFFQYGSWQEIMNQAASYADIVQEFRFLPQYRIDEPEKIRIVLDIANPSGRCQFTPVLLTDKGGEIPPVAGKDRFYEYTGDQLKQVIHPASGNFLVRIKVKLDEEESEGVQRMNHWKILRFQAEVFGRLAETARL